MRARAFLTDPSRDHEVQERRVQEDLLGLIESEYDVALRRAGRLERARERLARHVLLAELLARLPDEARTAVEALPGLRGMPRPRPGPAQAARLAAQ